MSKGELQTQMIVPSIRCPARLGVGDDERLRPQIVSVGLALRFCTTPSATVTDRLEDTVNYVDLVETVQAVCAAEEYRLLERLAKAVLEALRPTLPEAVSLWVEVAKERSPLQALEESARIGIGDALTGLSGGHAHLMRRAGRQGEQSEVERMQD